MISSTFLITVHSISLSDTQRCLQHLSGNCTINQCIRRLQNVLTIVIISHTYGLFAWRGVAAHTEEECVRTTPPQNAICKQHVFSFSLLWSYLRSLSPFTLQPVFFLSPSATSLSSQSLGATLSRVLTNGRNQ